MHKSVVSFVVDKVQGLLEYVNKKKDVEIGGGEDVMKENDQENNDSVNQLQRSSVAMTLDDLCDKSESKYKSNSISPA